MERLQGIAVSPGVAIGEALVLDNEGFRIPRRFLPRDAVEDELERLDRAMAAAAAEVERNRNRVAEQLGDQAWAQLAADLAANAESWRQAALADLRRQDEEQVSAQ